ncbi:MAG: hypothetical protein MRY21_04140 [Simkaniaceae bacterium]|nr:hypothetical protein [Simkaniaceae bacterium]
MSDCPITLFPMAYPLTLPCGHSFERKALIEHVLTGRRFCPMDRGEIDPSVTLAIDHALQSQIVLEDKEPKDACEYRKFQRAPWPRDFPQILRHQNTTFKMLFIAGMNGNERSAFVRKVKNTILSSISYRDCATFQIDMKVFLFSVLFVSCACFFGSATLPESTIGSQLSFLFCSILSLIALAWLHCHTNRSLIDGRLLNGLDRLENFELGVIKQSLERNGVGPLKERILRHFNEAALTSAESVETVFRESLQAPV